MPKDLSLASKYLISLSDKILISEYYESIKKSVDSAISILSTNQDLRKKIDRFRN